jgi:hypothetical protein
MNRILTTTLIGSAVAAALVVGTCAPALASTPTPAPKAPLTLAGVQTSAKTKIDERLGKLHSAIGKETSAKGVSSSDRATLLGRLNSDVSGLSALETKIAGDTTLAAATADYKTIFTVFRVDAVALPQTRIVSLADRAISTAIPRLTKVESKLSALLSGKDASKSTPALQADLTDMSAKIAAATSALNGVSSEALAVTPSEFNSNHSVFASARASAKTARTDLKTAVADAKAVRSAIK